MNNRFSKARCGYVQPLPRHPGTAQRAALEPFGLGLIFDEDEDEEARAHMVDQLRRGDVVHVVKFHMLAKRLKRTNHNMRLDLWAALRQVEAKGAVVIETATGRSTADKDQRDAMISEAIEVLTKGHKARSTEIARENGLKGGRPPKSIKPEQTKAARAAWFDPSLFGDKLKRAVKVAGYSMSRCYQEFGPRGGRST